MFWCKNSITFDTYLLSCRFHCVDIFYVKFRSCETFTISEYQKYVLFQPSNRTQFNNWYVKNIRIDVFFWTAKYDVFSGLGFWSFVIIMEVFFFGISNRLIVIRWYRYSAFAMEYYVVVDNFGFSLRNSFIFYFCVVISDLAWRITQFNKFLVISIECIF